MASAHALMNLPINKKSLESPLKQVKLVLTQACDQSAVEFVENPGIAGLDVLRTQLGRSDAAKKLTNVKTAAGTDIRRKGAVLDT